MASSGPNYAGTVNDSTATWTNESNALVSDNSYGTTNVPEGNSASEYLYFSNFGFSIPAGSTIDGVVVQVEGYATVVGATTPYWYVQLQMSPWTEKNVTVAASDGWKSLGGASDVWGATLTPAIVNGASWGFGVRGRINPSGTGKSADFYIDSVRVTVYYTEALTVTPGTLALTTTRYTPSAKVDNIATPAALSLTATRYAPSALLNNIATPGALSAALTAYTPDATVGLTVIPGTLATALTAYTPTVINPQSATPGAASLTLTPYSPSAVLKSIVTPTATALVLTAHAPSALLPVYVTPGPASLSLTPYLPTAVIIRYITIGATALAIATYGLNIYIPGSAFGARQYWRSTQHKEYTKLVPYRDYRRSTQHKDYIKSGKWVDRA